MATVQFGGGVSNAVGSHGGSTFSKNKGGSYIKKRGGTLNPRSTKQTAQRSVLSYLSNYFTNSLSSSDQAAWRTFASTQPTVNRLGNTTFLSGQQMFVKMSYQLQASGNALVDTPPISTAVTAPLTLTIDAVSGGGGHLHVTVNTTGSPGGEQCLIYASPAMSPGLNFISSALRFIDTSATPDVLQDLTAAWTHQFGSLPTGAGQRIFIRAMIFNTTNGVKSAAIQDTTLWT